MLLADLLESTLARGPQREQWTENASCLFSSLAILTKQDTHAGNVCKFSSGVMMPCRAAQPWARPTKAPHSLLCSLLLLRLLCFPECRHAHSEMAATPPSLLDVRGWCVKTCVLLFADSFCTSAVRVLIRRRYWVRKAACAMGVSRRGPRALLFIAKPSLQPHKSSQ